MRKRILSALLTVCMVAGMIPMAFATGAAGSWYDELIQDKTYRQYMNSGDVGAWREAPSTYCLIDIDQNGIPELLLRSDEDSPFSRILVFSYDERLDAPTFAGELYLYGFPRYSEQYHALVCMYPRPNQYYNLGQFYTLSNYRLNESMQVGWSDGRTGSEYYKIIAQQESDITESEYNEYYDDVSGNLKFSDLTDYFDLPFTDVTTSMPYYSDIALLYQDNIISGTSETTFSPDQSITRGMIVTLLYRMEGQPAVNKGSSIFTDVPNEAYFASAVAWAEEHQYVSGYGNGVFRPNNPITREQLATILQRYCIDKGYLYADIGYDSLLSMSDANQVSTYAIEAVSWALAYDLIPEIRDSVFAPKQNATRAQAAVALADIYREKLS